MQTIYSLVAGLALAAVACGDNVGQTPDGGDATSLDGALLDAGPTGDASQSPDAGPDPCPDHQLEDVMIPLRDGRSLAAFVRRATDPGCVLPTILIQTPYDKENARTLWFTQPEGSNPLFESTAYNFVVLDWRGFYGSAAAAVAQPEYGQDGYDAVEWIAAQPWSDGQVGTWGVSALCRVQHWTAVEQPPHLKAAVPIFCGMNNTYEMYYPGGVLRREYLDTIAFLFGANAVLSHPYRDATWLWLEGLYSAADVTIPMLIVAGWYDLYNTASLRTFDALRTQSPQAVRDHHRLLAGPWHHFAAGGESTGAGRPLTAQELQYYDGSRWIQHDSLAWFDYYLRGLPSEAAGWSAARTLQDGEGVWVGDSTWPPATVTPTSYYLHADQSLGTTAPVAGSVDFPYDPNDPSPTIGGQTLRPDLLHGPHDQNNVVTRDDAATFTTAPLATPLRIRGSVGVVLAVATTGADTDFAVRLTDVDSAGTHLLIGEGIHRLKLRDSLSTPSPVVPGQRYELTVTLANEHAYTFTAGHRIGLVITSSNHPRFDQNPNTGADFYTVPGAVLVVTNTIHTDGVSRLVLPVD